MAENPWYQSCFDFFKFVVSDRPTLYAGCGEDQRTAWESLLCLLKEKKYIVKPVNDSNYLVKIIEDETVKYYEARFIGILGGVEARLTFKDFSKNKSD
jgi:hypothetical protein